MVLLWTRREVQMVKSIKGIEGNLGLADRVDNKIRDTREYVEGCNERLEELRLEATSVRADMTRASDLLVVLLELRGVDPDDDPPAPETKPKKKKTPKKKKKKAVKKSPPPKKKIVKEEREPHRLSDGDKDKVSKFVKDQALEALRSNPGHFMTLEGLSLELCGESENKGLRDHLSGVLKRLSESGEVSGLERKMDGRRPLYRIVKS